MIMRVRQQNCKQLGPKFLKKSDSIAWRSFRHLVRAANDLRKAKSWLGLWHPAPPPAEAFPIASDANGQPPAVGFQRIGAADGIKEPTVLAPPCHRCGDTPLSLPARSGADAPKKHKYLPKLLMPGDLATRLKRPVRRDAMSRPGPDGMAVIHCERSRQTVPSCDRPSPRFRDGLILTLHRVGGQVAWREVRPLTIRSLTATVCL